MNSRSKKPAVRAEICGTHDGGLSFCSRNAQSSSKADGDDQLVPGGFD